MGLLGAPLVLVAARARRRPGRWVLTVLGVALSTAFAGAVSAESTIAGDQAARSVLSGLAPLDRTVRVSWQGLVTPSVERQARTLLDSFDLRAQTKVVLLSPVRLSGVVVRPAAIDPLDRWIRSGNPPGACNADACPMLLAGGAVRQTALTAAGVRIPIVGKTQLVSAAPLGFIPGTPSDQPPVLVSGDVNGLDGLAGLGVYRTHSWLAALPSSGLRSWQVGAIEQRLQQVQAALLASGSQFSLTAPFDGLDAARSQSRAAPRRLLLAGGGALAALGLFIVLAAAALRRDQSDDVERLRLAGARTSQCLVFVISEAAWLSAIAVIIGAVLGVAVAALLAGGAGEPVGGVLAHSLITPAGVAACGIAWVCATALVAVLLLAPSTQAADLLAVAAVAALALSLTRTASGDDPLPVLLAPLCCLAAGVLTFRAAATLLRAGERLARRGPVLARLSLVGLARSPAAPSLAIAFIAVSTGLGGFALAYRATLLRGTADQAAARVPLDAIVAPGTDFTSPLDVASLQRWRSIAGGTILPVRRTEATFASGGATVTVPALGVPANGLARLRGWRAGDGPAPLSVLARRLSPPGLTRVAGPLLAPKIRSLVLTASSPEFAVRITADLRDATGAITQVPLGDSTAAGAALHGRVPRGRWELEALELDVTTGLEITNGHQNAENPAPSTRFETSVTLGTLATLGSSGRVLSRLQLGGWRATGAASAVHAGARGPVVRFAATGKPGLLRPRQPSDVAPLPVLVDPQTAAAAGRDGRMALTIDGLAPVAARVVGALARFPTIAPDAAGFVLADQAALASALDAQLPGQGRADELWLAPTRPGSLRAALQRGPFAQLSSTFRHDVEHQLRAAPIARAVLDTLLGATALCGVLAVLGLLVALLGATRDDRAQRDLAGQGVGPRGLRRELRLRLLLAGALGVVVGLGVAVVLARLAVASVRAAGTVAVPQPPLVTVAPWGELGLWGLTALLALAGASWLGERAVVGRRRPR